MPVFIPSTPAPTHLGRFRAPGPGGSVGVLSTVRGGAFLPDLFPGARQIVEAAFGADLAASPATWIWTDITRWVLWDPGVMTQIGYRDEASELTPASFSAVLRNDQVNGGNFTLGNPLGIYWPNVRENTPIRATLNLGAGPDSTRFFGYATTWAPEWDADRSYAVVALQAHGVSRRLRQGTSASKSAMRRSYDYGTVTPLAYWSLEGGSGASVSYDLIANLPSVVGGFTGLVDEDAGAPTFGASDLGFGSDRVCNIAGGWNLDLNLPTGTTATSSIFLEFSMAFGTTVRTGTYAKCGIRHNPYTAAKHLAWNVFVNDSGLIEVQWFESDPSFALLAGPTTIYSAGSENIFDGAPRVFQLALTASGGTNVAWVLYENDVSIGSGTITPSFAGAMNSAAYRSAALSTAGASQTAALGHVAIFNADPGRVRYQPLIAYRGEFPHTRLARVCAEQHVTMDLVGTSDLGMGPQQIGSFLDIVAAAATADSGILVDGLGAGFTYTCRESAYSNTAALTLRYRDSDFKGPLKPEHDDQYRLNDFTARNPDGLERRYVQTTGDLGTLTVGTYDDAQAINLDRPDNLLQMAAWRTAQGTVPGLRYPTLTFQLAKPRTSTKAGLWLNARPFSRVDAVGIATPPNTDRALLLRGWAERWNSKLWSVVANCTPNDVFDVTVLAADTLDTNPSLGWLDTDVTTTAAALSSGGSSVSVNVTGPVWTNAASPTPTYADDLVGLYVNLDGMRVGVTAINNATSPQTMSLTTTDVLRDVPAGASVSVWNPVVLGL